jgi:hypothetical protein
LLIFIDGIEITTRVYTVNENWKTEIEQFWFLLSYFFNIKHHKSCGTHIHVSHVGGYSLRHVQQLVKGMGYFNRALLNNDISLGFMPPSRLATLREGGVAEDNFPPNRSEVFGALGRGDFRSFFRFIDAFTSLELLQREICPGRYKVWNLVPLSDSRGTIEFRLPPGVDQLQSVLHWAAFTLGFFAACLFCPINEHKVGGRPPQSQPSQLSEILALRAFIVHGADFVMATSLLSWRRMLRSGSAHCAYADS